MDLFPSHTVIYDTEENDIFNDNIEVVVVDDWTLTGISLESSISNFRENNKNIKYSSLTFIITYCSVDFLSRSMSRKLIDFVTDQEFIDILSRGAEKLGGFKKLGITVEDFPDIMVDFLPDIKEFPDISSKINDYMDRKCRDNYYYYENLYPLDISHLNSLFTDIFMDIVECTFFIIHSEYKIPDSTLFRPLLNKCRDPVDRDFLNEVRKYFT